ncbi:hypothetical protein IFM89_038530 [Coptis chinensis]|uniref:SGT1 n=1 Tax=Coptis chinensis TaxID=261450 RepID=A0A835M302_9MAGN|nr:hypothetical protein IFM89_038530 [Coptis chinensis]
MASEMEKKAKEAFVDDNLELAVDLYSQAIDMDGNNADLFADRAQANIKLSNFTEAVSDANRAIELDTSMAKAYLRKGTACLKLEEFQTAKAALEAGASLAPGDARFSNLIKECDQRIAEELGDLTKHPVGNVAPVAASPSVSANSADGKSDENSTLSHQATVTTPAKPKFRHEFYQKPEEVVVTVFAKGVPAKYVVVDFGEQILSVTIDIPGEDVYHFQPRLFGKATFAIYNTMKSIFFIGIFPSGIFWQIFAPPALQYPVLLYNTPFHVRLYGKQIKPENCRYQVLSTKIEVRLAKAEAINWTSLEFTKEQVVSQKLNTSSAGEAGRPTYPSSKSKSRGVNWDKIEAQVKKEEKEEKLDGDAALNKFFRDIYQGSDDDIRRAMSKSFVESNGTVLSTNWKEVGAKKVEGSPPDGMEMKKWEY